MHRVSNIVFTTAHTADAKHTGFVAELLFSVDDFFVRCLAMYELHVSASCAVNVHGMR